MKTEEQSTMNDLPVEQSFDHVAHRLLADLHAPSARVYWTDLLITAAVGWGSFAYGMLAMPFSAAQWTALAIAAFALYRGLCFVHEISHMRSSALRGFETTWNLLFGATLL